MKKSHCILFGLLTVALVACKRENSLNETNDVKKTKESILGKWQLQQATVEYYQPVNVLADSEEHKGDPGDSCIFKSNNLLYSYQTGPNGVEEEIIEYKLVNNTTIVIDDETYKISKLTATEMKLVQEETSGNEKHVSTGFFTR